MFKKLLSTPYIIWLIGFVLIPIAAILYYAVTTTNGEFTFDNITAIADTVHLKPLMYSLLIAFISTVICLVLAYPIALIVGRSKRAKRSTVIFLFILPMWMNYILRILALRIVLMDNGVLNGMLSALGLGRIHVMNTAFAVILGMVYDYLPFMILPIYNAVVKIDPFVIDAAQDLGADSFRVFRKIILPQSMPGVISGITMVFIPAISEYVIVDLMGGGKISLIGNVIEQEFLTAYNWNSGSGLSLVLMIFVITSLSIVNRYDKDREAAAVW